MITPKKPETWIAEHVQSILKILTQEFNLELDDPNLKDTPHRVARAYLELLSGYNEDPDMILGSEFPSGKYDQMIIAKGIEFSSLCIHHLMPFHGKISVGYIPASTGVVIGLSKIPRVCEVFAKRLQIQECLTQQIATAIMGASGARGVGVVISDCVHTCASMRGIKAHGMSVTTSALLGEFLDDASVRREFLSLIK